MSGGRSRIFTTAVLWAVGLAVLICAEGREPGSGDPAPGPSSGERVVSIRIHAERLSEIPISRFVTGNFIEKGFGRQVSGMWAEMIYNRSFQEVPPYKSTLWNSLELRPELYNPEAPFWHSGYEEYDWELIGDGSVSRRRGLGRDPFKGASSLELSQNREGAAGGLRQRGLYFRKGIPCRFELFAGIRGPKTGPPLPGFPAVDSPPPPARPLTVRFVRESDGTLLFSRDIRLTALPSEFAFSVDPGEFEGRAALEIIFEWKGTLVLAWCSLMPEDHRRGWRGDVLDRLREVAPPVLRFPGGCYASFADWRHAVGPRGSRPAKESFFWGGLEENDVGVDEFLDLCRELGSEPQICVNMMTGSPARAAELVEYCNGADDSRMGRFRRENGVERKLRVRFWEMDNEAGRKWSPLQYARETRRFAAAMREVDPEIEILMEYYSWEPALGWLPQMLEIAGDSIDYVVHRTRDPDFYRRAIEILRAYNREHGTRIRHANTEWVASYDSPEPFSDPELKRTHSWEDATLDAYKRSRKYRQNRWFYALNASAALLDFMSLGGEFYLANFNNCVNTWGQNIIEASRETAWLSPAGLVFRFFRGFDDRFPLRSEIWGVAPNLFRALACETGEGHRLYLLNLSGEERSVRIEAPASFGEPGDVEFLSAPDRLSRTYAGRSDVRGSRGALDGSGRLRVPPLALGRVFFRK